MKLLPQGSSVLFLGTAGIGSNFGPTAPQLRSFDVFYVQPPVVGLQIVGSTSEED